jgi:hypothetical protein
MMWVEAGTAPEVYPLLVCTRTVPLKGALWLVMATSARKLTIEALLFGYVPCLALP